MPVSYILPIFHAETNAGLPLVAGQLFTYLSGTTTPATTYSNDSGTANTNPIILNARGEARVFLDDAVSYTFLLKDVFGVTIWTQDGVKSANSAVADLILQLADSDGSSKIGFIQSGLAAVAHTAEEKMRQIVSLFDFMTDAEIADCQSATPSMDHTNAMKAFRNAISGTSLFRGGIGWIPNCNLNVTDGITFQYCEVQGAGGGYYAPPRTTVRKTNGDTNSNFVLRMDYGTLKGVATICPATQTYTNVDYNPQPGSTTSGIICGTTSTVEDCYAESFFQGIWMTGGGSASVRFSRVFTCNFGINNEAADSMVTDCFASHCQTANIRQNATLFRLNNNRVEWSARDGYSIVYGNGAITGGLGDRNGGAALSIIGPNSYDISVVGLTCNRSGCSGDGSYGRWGFATPAGGAASGYLANMDLSCHIFMSNPNGVTITGCSFYNYGDDLGQGCVGPRYVYVLQNCNNVTIKGNSENVGYNVDFGYYGGAGVLPASSGAVAKLLGTNYINEELSVNGKVEIEKYLGVPSIPTGYGAEFPVSSVSGKATQVAPGFLGFGYGNTPPFSAVTGGTVALSGWGSSGAGVTAFPTMQVSMTGALYGGDGSAAPGRFLNPSGTDAFFERDLGFFPDNAKSCGRPYARASIVYAGTGAINTSDRDSKQDIGAPSEAVMRAWGQVQYVQYKFRDAVQEKGEDKARWHFGLVAQQVREVFEAAGLDPFAMGLLCFDQWDDVYDSQPAVLRQKMTSIPAVTRPKVELIGPSLDSASGVVTYASQKPVLDGGGQPVMEEIAPAKEVPEFDADGNPVMEEVEPARQVLVAPAGSRYGIRYEEALALEAAYLRWRLDGLSGGAA